jgi:hypothetical protein
MEVQLAGALPERYLQWIAFVVALEQAVRKDPRLRAKAARRRLVYGPSAQAAHRIIYQPITDQAEQADAEGINEIRPLVEAEPEELDEVVGYLQRWGEWLVEEGISEQAKVPMPPPEIAALRTQVVKDLRTRPGHP